MIPSQEQVEKFAKTIEKSGKVFIHSFIDGHSAPDKSLIGITLSASESGVPSLYIPLGHDQSRLAIQDMFNEKANGLGNFDRDDFIKIFKPIFQNHAITKFTHDSKDLFQALWNIDDSINLNDTGWQDIVLACQMFVIDEPDYNKNGERIKGKNNLREVIKRFQPAMDTNNIKIDWFEDIILSTQPNKRKRHEHENQAEIPLDKAITWGKQRVQALTALAKEIRQHVNCRKTLNLYKEVDQPIISIIARMEWDGLYMDPDQLEKADAHSITEINNLKDDIIKLAHISDTPDIDNPEELSRKILFRTLKPLGVVTPKLTGQNDRDNATLNKIKENLERKSTGKNKEATTNAINIINKILEYNALKKPRNSFSKSIHSKTGRIHTTYSTNTATNRFSASNPCVQGIEKNEDIRSTVKPRPGKAIISCDYSQIQLRILAALGNVKPLIQAYQLGKDVHQQTADNLGITRAQAKAINFSIIYGKTAQSLAEDLMCETEEAQALIDKFETEFGIDKLKKATVLSAASNGYVTTMSGRKLGVSKQILQSHRAQHHNKEKRRCMNYPIQGTDAEIMKQAIIDVNALIYKKYPDARILLTLHDELILEVDQKHAEQMTLDVITTMEEAYSLVSIDGDTVPIVVDGNYGQNWFDAQNKPSIRPPFIPLAHNNTQHIAPVTPS